MKRLLALAAPLLTTIALVAGCGGGGADHNDQDVSFAKDMVPHHQQAVVMADMALAQTNRTEVQDLATRIKESQTSEISIMNGWLTSWNATATDHSGHDAGAMNSMAGMVSDVDMQTLGSTAGKEFDRLFLQHMTAHHKGALEMAKVQLDKGKYGPAKELAREITTGQEKEIAEMDQLLKSPLVAAP